MNYKSIAAFDHDLKILAKKYRSLPEDLTEFQKIVSRFPLGTGKHFAVLGRQRDIAIIKARLFCRYLRGSSLRIIYSYHEATHTIEFIELYFKGDKPLEDSERIRGYLKSRRG